MKKNVAVIEYGMGNIDSVGRAVQECGGTPFTARSTQDLKRADAVIMPGVGSFKEGMKRLEAGNFPETLTELVVKRKIPFLGICLGMQLLAVLGQEGGEYPGLGWIEGTVVRLEPSDQGERIPHMGWNEIFLNQKHALFDRIPDRKDFYFCHSYHMTGVSDNFVLTKTPYCGDFVSSIAKENIFGVQFHPEKSQRAGFQLIRNFLRSYELC